MDEKKKKNAEMSRTVANAKMRDKIFQKNRHSSYYHYAKNNGD